MVFVAKSFQRRIPQVTLQIPPLLPPERVEDKSGDKAIGNMYTAVILGCLNNTAFRTNCAESVPPHYCTFTHISTKRTRRHCRKN